MEENLNKGTNAENQATDDTGKKPVETKRRLKFQSPITVTYVPKKQKSKKAAEKSTESADGETDENKQKSSPWKKVKTALEFTVLLGGCGLAAYGKYKMDEATAKARNELDSGYEQVELPDPAEVNPSNSEDSDE